MQTRRLFVGIGLSPALKKRLSQTAEAWPQAGFILTRPGNFHVILSFLGFRKEEDIPSIIEQLEIVSGEMFDMSFTDIVYAPDEERASMVWLTGESHTELLKLKNNIDEALGSLTPPKQSFRPHVTLAKIRRKVFATLSPRPAIQKSVRYVEPVSSFTLFESLSVDGKREYQALAEFPLTAV